MATTVNVAFNEFMRDHVNLDQSQVSQARSSRDWLIEKINAFSDKHSDFPEMYEERNFSFGSFARSTKRRPLDDIDLLLCMKAKGVTYTEHWDGRVTMTVPDTSEVFKKLLKDSGDDLSSIKVINRFLKYIDEVPQYEKAESKRNKEAATLTLSSYDWNFDIVPCFFTSEESDGRQYYLIPDGKGDWKKTDPRLDKERATSINKKNDGNVLNVVRIMKYWNGRKTMATMSSYLLENMILDYYESNSASKWVDWEVRDTLTYIRDNIYSTVCDPKNIEGNINNLTMEEKSSIYNRANQDLEKALSAISEETDNPAYAIGKWREIFGDNFPKYG